MPVSPFVLCGALLAATSFAGVVDVVIQFVDGEGRFQLEAGLAGLAAATVGWAGFARTPARAGGRAAAVSAVYLWIFALLFVGFFLSFADPLLGVQLGWASADRAVDLLWLVVPFLVIMVVFGVLAGIAGSAAGAYVASPRTRTFRLVLAAAALGPVVGATLEALDDGALPATAIGSAGAVWLVWALRRARDTRELRQAHDTNEQWSPVGLAGESA